MIFGSRNTPQDRLRAQNMALLRENSRLKRDLEKLNAKLSKTDEKLAKAKEPSLTDLKKRAWKWFSKWTRLRDGGKCFTCGVVKNYKEMDAGHYIDASICGAILHLFPRNVHAQCTTCNQWKHGAKAAYRKNIVELYGQAKVDHLDQIRVKTVGIFKPSRQYYISMAAKYKAKFEALDAKEKAA